MSERLCTSMAQVTLSSFSPSFNSSSNLSNNSSYRSICNGGEPGAYSVDSSPIQPSNGPEIAALQRLSTNLESLLNSSDFDCSDAEIIVEDQAIPVHRCILAARSPFFKEIFFPGNCAGKCPEPASKLKYELKDWLTVGDVGYEAFMILLGYLYSGKVKAPPQGVCTCMDITCVHDACRPAVDFAVELMYAASVFRISELVSLSQRRLLNFVEKAQVEDVIPILTVAYACETGSDQLLTRCIQRVARSDLDIVALGKELPQEVVKEVNAFRSKTDLGAQDRHSLQDRNIRRIQRALDSDDVELVKLLLEEGEGRTTLDAANALHYAAAYCDPKITTELLDLDCADVNLRNARGYTVLHIAAMRREPTTIVALLTKGARPLDLTSDERTALQISRRLTRAVDYYRRTERGKESPKDRLCIEILEQAESRNPLLADVSFPFAGENLKMKLLYLENRVALAKLLFPMEAKLAMEIAHVDTTYEFTGVGGSNAAFGNRRTTVDLNETPAAVNNKLISRLTALLRTVELGKRFFPRCSEVLNKFMDDDLTELACLGKGTTEEQRVKRKRYDELKDVLSEAFSKDKADFERSGMSSSSSSSSVKDGVNQRNAKNR
eukprot:Gb_18895 [translate_table: standard]